MSTFPHLHAQIGCFNAFVLQASQKMFLDGLHRVLLKGIQMLGPVADAAPKLLGLKVLARLHEVHRAIAVTPVVHVPLPVTVPVRVRVTLALKFSRSLYLDNHSSESIHTWTIDTL